MATYSSRLPSPLKPLEHIWRTAYAFTKSDYKTVVFPVICYGIMAAPQMSITRLPHLAVWVWLHLLQFCAANQALSPEEDALNKPYRPIPAGLISIRGARVLRWLLVPVCLALSWTLDVIYPGISLAISFVVYNELGLDNYWYTKNFLNAVGLVSWNIGAAKIACAENVSLDQRAWFAPYVSTLLIATTIHIQDFRDEAGDRKQGRVTFPVVMPEFSRRMTFLIVAVWSFGLASYWNLSSVASPWFVTLGMYVALRVLQQRTEHEDKVSLRIYMVRCHPPNAPTSSPPNPITCSVLAVRCSNPPLLDKANGGNSPAVAAKCSVRGYSEQ
ncbi:hypothetical protein PLEOSDRAFT_1050368 [Pleurotus ostreatus PC15]|uniref:UbiA prenyltransferase n=1 Tax=Pleurotus ostreatus (strain PC15) TaxID=1137138 RepID=A0A067N3J1_PLEO1|nr:hypothetical protein PLEOSDRAFT_1050368 [Pleurotus ostreatus PC15]